MTKQDESALSAIYDAASKEEPDEMKADLMHDAIADIFLNDVHDPKDRKSAIDRLLDRLAEAIFGKELREKVQKLGQGTITPQQMKENYERIYFKEAVQHQVRDSVVPMMEQMYEQIYRDAVSHDRSSCLYQHHIASVLDKQQWYPAAVPYEETDPHDLTVDFIAAMTDDYFVDYYAELFPKSKYHISYIGYFE